MTIVAFFDTSFLATLPGRRIEPAVMDRHGTVRSGDITLYSSDHGPYAHSTCVQPHVEKRAPFTVGLVRIRANPRKVTLELCDRLSTLLIEVDIVIHEDCPDMVCDLGYGVAPCDVLDAPPTGVPAGCFYVLWPGKPTESTITTFVEDYTWFETFADNNCATTITCIPAPHLRRTKTKGDTER